MVGDFRFLRAGLGVVLATCLGVVAPGCGSKAEDKPSDSKEDKKAEDKPKDEKEGTDTIGGPNGKGGDGVGNTPEAASYVADSGFRPAQNGFLFQNGDRDPSNKRLSYPESSPGHLDKFGMRRLFGSDKVCLGLDEGECVLTPGAHEFMHMVNYKMNGGQCEGLAVFALSMFRGYDPVDAFKDQATMAADLGRDDVRGPVGYYFAYQFLQPFRNELFGTMGNTTPNQVLDTITTALQSKEDLVSLEFFQPGVGGHAVVPYAVEDRGNGLFWVRIWDNNWPKASRYIEFDRNKNSWKYSAAAINPDTDAEPWGGTAARNTIVAMPVKARLKDAVCPFCERDTGVRMLMTTGAVSAMITDSQGRRVGMENGKLVNEIPGAQAHEVLSYVPGGEAVEPLYELPATDDYNVELSSNEVKEGNGQGAVGIFGSGSAMVVDDIAIEKGQKDKVSLPKDGKGLDYVPGGTNRNPKVRLSYGSGKDSYRIELRDLKPKKGARTSFRFNKMAKSIDVAEDGQEKKFKFKVTRFVETGQSHTVTDDDDKDAAAKPKKGLSFGQLTANMPKTEPRKPNRNRARLENRPRYSRPGKPAPDPQPERPEQPKTPRKPAIGPMPGTQPTQPKTPPKTPRGKMKMGKQ
jgi:hypothetical protein